MKKEQKKKAGQSGKDENQYKPYMIVHKRRTKDVILYIGPIKSLEPW